MPLERSEWVVRAALWPRIVEAGSGLVSPEQIVSGMGPKTFASGGTGFALSVGRLLMLTSDDAVHDFGCRVAAAANASFEAKNNRPPKRVDETVHYLGSYDLHVEKIVDIDSDVFSIAVEYFPENGLLEHCDIELHPKGVEVSNNKKKNARTGVIAKLMLLLTNPRPYISRDDDDLRGILERIPLPEFQPAPMVVAAGAALD